MKEPLHVCFLLKIDIIDYFPSITSNFGYVFFYFVNNFFFSCSGRIAAKWNLFCQIRVGLRVNDLFLFCQFCVRYWVEFEDSVQV